MVQVLGAELMGTVIDSQIDGQGSVADDDSEHDPAEASRL